MFEGYLAELKKLAEDSLPGGLADGKTDAHYSTEQLDKGQKVEMEHTDDAEKAREIAKDHLEEHPDYYTRLAKMESQADREKKAGYAGRYPAEVLGDKTIPFAQKRQALRSYAKAKSKETPLGVGTGAGIGALVGGGTGALIGAASGGGAPGAIGLGLGGAAAGGLIGALSALVDEGRIDEAKSLARSKNIDPALVTHIAQRRTRNKMHDEMRRERRHQQLLGAISGRTKQGAASGQQAVAWHLLKKKKKAPDAPEARGTTMAEFLQLMRRQRPMPKEAMCGKAHKGKKKLYIRDKLKEGVSTQWLGKMIRPAAGRLASTAKGQQRLNQFSRTQEQIAGRLRGRIPSPSGTQRQASKRMFAGGLAGDIMTTPKPKPSPSQLRPGSVTEGKWLAKAAGDGRVQNLLTVGDQIGRMMAKEAYSRTVGGLAAGAALGAGLGALTSEDTTGKGRARSAVIGGLAGGTLGGAIGAISEGATAQMGEKFRQSGALNQAFQSGRADMAQETLSRAAGGSEHAKNMAQKAWEMGVAWARGGR
jgi:hypothetical protein